MGAGMISKWSRGVLLVGVVVSCVFSVWIGSIGLREDPQEEFSQDIPHLIELCVLWAVAVFLPFALLSAGLACFRWLCKNMKRKEDVILI